MSKPTAAEYAEAREEHRLALRQYQIARDVDFVAASERYHAAVDRLTALDQRNAQEA